MDFYVFGYFMRSYFGVQGKSWSLDVVLVFGGFFVFLGGFFFVVQ